MAGRARAAGPAPGADERLRGAPRLVAPRTVLCGPRRAADRVRGRTGLHPRRVPAGDGAPVRRLVGVPGHRLLRADRALRRPGRLPVPGRHAAPGRDRGHPGLGTGALPARTTGPWPGSTVPPCTSTPTRGGANTPTGVRYVFDYGRAEVRNFLVANALYWLEEFHVDGLRVDAVASMLYLDYSRNEGEWAPNGPRRAGEPRRDRLLQELNATVYKLHPGIDDDGRGVDRVARRDPSTADGGLGFGFKWNMGWMHDTLVYVGKDPIHRQYHHNQLTFAAVYAWSENFVLPISHDEVVHGKRVAARQDARATSGSGWPTSGRCWPSCGPSRASSCCSWAASSATSGSGASSAGWTGGCATTPPRRGGPRSSATSTRVTATTGTVDFGHHAGRLPLDRRRRRGQQRVRLPAHGADGSRSRLRRQLLRRPARELPARAAVRGSLARGASTPTPRCTAAPASATSVSVHADGHGWHGLPASATLRLPPLGGLWLRPA